MIDVVIILLLIFIILRIESLSDDLFNIKMKNKKSKLLAMDFGTDDFSCMVYGYIDEKNIIHIDKVKHIKECIYYNDIEG